MVILFLSPVPLQTSPPFRLPSQCKRVRPSANINKTTDSSREDEIAAKIASLRKQKRLNSNSTSNSNSPDASKSSQSSDIEPTAAAASSTPPATPVPSETDAQDVGVFSSLPDWKKEEILSGTMREAESFFNRGVSKTDSLVIPVPDSFPTSPPSEESDDTKNDNNTKNEDNEDNEDDKYKPRVSTWGVFPRPDNISRTYGGGRNIKQGGIDLNSEQMKKRDEDVAKRLAAYRSARGIDTEKEEAHRDEIEAALSTADICIKRTQPYDAIEALEAIVPFISDRSRLGGRVLLSLALAYDTVGRREGARDLYTRLRSSAFSEISSKARQLLEGFTAMEQLGVTDDSNSEGLRVTDFSLPDVNVGVEKRYETAVLGVKDVSRRPMRVGAGVNAALAALMLAPVLILAAMVATRGH